MHLAEEGPHAVLSFAVVQEHELDVCDEAKRKVPGQSAQAPSKCSQEHTVQGQP